MKFNSPQPAILVVYCSTSLGGLVCLPNLAQAQIPSQLVNSRSPLVVSAKQQTQPARMPTLNLIGATTALQEGATVQVFPGRASIINFRTDEFITSVTLSDPTYVLYTPNAEIESGQTTALILRLSNGIPFENLSRSSKPNISITTVNSENQQTTYLFDLEIASGLPQANRQDYNGIAIVPDDEAIVITGNIIKTPKGDATMNDVERGLRISIRRGFTARADPIVNQVREVLAQARQGGSLGTIAPQMGVPLSVLSALGELGLERSGGQR
jgi:hypothetical protein